MSKAINFYIKPLPHFETYGSPIHDGKIPRARHEISAVRIDGEPVDFMDSSLPDRLHKALLTGKGIKRRGTIFDCKIFSALMEGIDIGTPNDRGIYELGSNCIDQEVSDSDRMIEGPLNLGRYISGLGIIRYLHTVSPAHTQTEAQYIHKLGNEGPICLSGLNAAKNMYRCDFAFPALLEPNS